jgi:hypothetical protein
MKSKEGSLLLKVYFPGASDEPVVASYERLKTLYGEDVVFSREADGA